MTISMNASHYGNRLEFNVHNYFGFLEGFETYNYFKKEKEAPFIIARSTMPGSGKFVNHW
jgi:alpha-glucosidase